MKILHPIESQHRRVTQWFWENFKWKWKNMYGPGGWIPSWPSHMWIDFTSRENKFWSVKPLAIRAGIDWSLRAFKHNGMWNTIEINIDWYRVRYMHLDSFEGGDREVKQWEIIGYTGNTGTYTTAAHLHMDVKKNGSYINFTDLLVSDIEKQSLFDIWVSNPNRDIFGLAKVILDKYGKACFYKEDWVVYIKNTTHKWHLDDKSNASKEEL